MHNSVLFLNKGPQAASSRYRATMYQELFESAGWCFQELPCNDGFFSRLKLLTHAQKFRWVVIQRKLFGPLFLRLLRLSNPNIVFDFDDAIFLKSSGEPSTKRQTHFSQTMKVVKHVWGGNDYLVSHANKFDVPAEVIPTAIDIERYQIKEHTEHSEGLTLVWIGSSSTKKYLDEFKTTFEAIGEEIPTLTLLVVADFEFSLDNITVKNIPWSLESEQTSLQAADIGIAPMTDNPWTQGKCALKVLQYMAAGLPVVSSNCGANAEVISEGETGFLGNSAEQWIEAINQLNDYRLRARFGKLAREKVEKGFTTQVCFQKMLASLES